MKAARVLGSGPHNAIINDDLPRPVPAARKLLIRVKRSGDRASASKAPHFRQRKPGLGGDVSDYLVFYFYHPGMGAHARVPRNLGFTRPVFVEGYRTSRCNGLYRRRSIHRGLRTRDTSRTHRECDVSQALVH
jgi:hypothetical protein